MRASRITLRSWAARPADGGAGARVKIEVRLFAGLRDRFPREQRGRADLELPSGSTLTQLLDSLNIPPKQAQMVLLNGAQVPRSPGVRESRLLADGDVVAVFPPVAGG